jgi:hypothetical protein
MAIAEASARAYSLLVQEGMQRCLPTVPYTINSKAAEGINRNLTLLTIFDK